MSIETKFIDPIKGKRILESVATLAVCVVALVTSNPLAIGGMFVVMSRVIWEVWQEDKQEIPCP